MATTKPRLALERQTTPNAPLRSETDDDYIVPGKLRRTEDCPVGHGRYSYFRRIEFSGDEEFLKLIVNQKVSQAKTFCESVGIKLPETEIKCNVFNFPNNGIAQIYAEEYIGGKKGTLIYPEERDEPHELIKDIIDAVANYIELRGLVNKVLLNSQI